MRLMLFIVLVSIIACKELQHNSNPAPLQVKQMIENTPEVPRLIQLGQLAKTEIEQATNEEMVNALSEKYKTIIHNYLADSSHSVIEEMIARVERVEPSTDQVYVSLHHEMFKFYAYVDKAEKDRPALNEIFQRVKKMRVNSDTTLKMIYLGECELGFFKDQFEITIKAVPVPTNLKVDNKLVQQLKLLQ